MKRWLLALGCLCAGLAQAAAAAPGKKAPITAVFARVEGEVTVEEASARADNQKVLHRAARFMMLGRDDRVHVAQKGAAGLICSDDRWVEIPANSDQVLTEDFCRAGRPVAAGDYAALASFAGAVRTDRGAIVLERSPRSDSSEESPRLLSPRDTALIEGRPLLVWTRVAEAASYRVEIRGGVAWRQVVEAGDCGSDKATCSLPWPESAPLPPDTAVTVLIAAVGKGGLIANETPPPWLRRLSKNEVSKVGSALAAISGLALGEDQKALLEAELLAAAKLISAAIAHLSEAERRWQNAQLCLNLGKAYLLAGLNEPAETWLLEATATGAAPDIAASAALGLAQIDWLRGDTEAARQRLAEAEIVFSRLGMVEEREAARNLATRLAPGKPSAEHRQDF